MCVSVEHDDSPRMGAVRAVVLESQYLLEPCGTGRTRLTHISRVDLRCGRTSSALRVNCLINTAVINVRYLLLLSQGKISRMVQQSIWSPLHQWGPKDPLLVSPTRSDEHRGQDLNPRNHASSWVTLSEQLGLRPSDPGGESSRRWTLVSFHSAAPRWASLYWVTVIHTQRGEYL